VIAGGTFTVTISAPDHLPGLRSLTPADVETFICTAIGVLHPDADQVVVDVEALDIDGMEGES
jgi:hypothetical protein